MVKYSEINMNIFETDTNCIVNPVNSIGVMGNGLALQFKEKYPKQCEHFNNECKKFNVFDVYKEKNYHLIKPMFFQKENWNSDRNILMFPTKIHWKHDSQLEYIEKSAEWSSKILNLAKETSIAIPFVGCGLGGLNWENVKPILIKHFNNTMLDRVLFVNFI